jgi:hypothetical protein
MAGALLKWLRMEDKIVRFKFIDMFVIAKKDDEAEPPTPDP